MSRAPVVVAIVPARGGSKGIPGKNLRSFCGAPLLVWTLRQALASRRVDHVFVTSDDEKILEVARAAGARGIRRPPELSTDTASSEAALHHAIEHIERVEGIEAGLVVFLQATSPLREPSDIDRAIETLEAQGADSLFSASASHLTIWEAGPEGLRGLTFDAANRKRRQDMPPQFLENGSIYLFKPEVLRAHDNRLGGRIGIYEMPSWKSAEIDDLADFDLCEWLFRRHLLSRQQLRPAREDVSLIVYDFDGVLTDNRVLTLEDGREAVLANRSDGLAIKRLREAGVPQFILSTETNGVVSARARKVGIPVFQGVEDKGRALEELSRKENVPLDRVLYVGNDLNDLPAMRIAGWTVAPSDAHPAVRDVARIVLDVPGGAGVARAIAALLIDGSTPSHSHSVHANDSTSVS